MLHSTARPSAHQSGDSLEPQWTAVPFGVVRGIGGERSTSDEVKAPRRVGIYVDGDNIGCNGARVLEYQILREFFARDGEVVRLRVFCGYDPLRYRADSNYATMIDGRRRAVEAAGGTLFLKRLKEKEHQGIQYLSGDTDGMIVLHAICDAIDLRLKRVVFVTGDGDFVEPVQELRRRDLVVDVVAFANVHWYLRRVASSFIDGFAIPGLIRPRRRRRWGGAAEERGEDQDGNAAGLVRR